MRQILHIDMNSYFATVEQQANPKLRGKPIAVLGSTTKRSIIVAASIEAKKFGVKTAMRIEEAMEKCPSLILVNGEPRKYSWVTKQFVHIFEDYTDKVEIFSIDECFLDVTKTVKLFENTANIQNSKFEIQNSEWFGAINIAMEIKKRIREEIGAYISCSVGVSYNKFLAKTGSDLKKPDGLVVISPNPKTQIPDNKENGIIFLTVDEALLPLPLEEYCGIGRKIRKRLSQIDINTTQQLRDFPNTLLNREFGIVTGEKLKRMAFGLDSSPVTSWRDQPPAKSFSCSRTLNKDVYKMDEIKKQILFLFEKVAKNMRDDGYLCQEVGIWLRFKDFSGAGKQARISKWSDDGLEMYEEALKILKKLKIISPVRAIGVYVGKVQKKENISKSLLAEDQQNEKILSAMDAVNNRFGADVVTRGRLVKTKLKEVVSGMGRKKF